MVCLTIERKSVSIVSCYLIWKTIDSLNVQVKLRRGGEAKVGRRVEVIGSASSRVMLTREGWVLHRG